MAIWDVLMTMSAFGSLHLIPGARKMGRVVDVMTGRDVVIWAMALRHPGLHVVTSISHSKSTIEMFSVPQTLDVRTPIVNVIPIPALTAKLLRMPPWSQTTTVSVWERRPLNPILVLLDKTSADSSPNVQRQNVDT